MRLSNCGAGEVAGPIRSAVSEEEQSDILDPDDRQNAGLRGIACATST